MAESKSISQKNIEKYSKKIYKNFLIIPGRAVAADAGAYAPRSTKAALPINETASRQAARGYHEKTTGTTHTAALPIQD